MKFRLPIELEFIRNGRLPQKKSNESARGLQVLLTGATHGIGYETAKLFASKGGSLIILVRNETLGKKLLEELERDYSCKSKLYIADFEKLDQVREALVKIKQENKKIDILINNAGAHRTQKKILESGIDAVFTVNHLASFLITEELIPLLEKSEEARIININSEGHRFGKLKMDDLNWDKRIYTGLRSYGASKSAQLHAMHIWKRILAQKRITINSLHPGVVRSNIGNHSGKIYNLYLKYIISPTLKNPEVSASAIYYLATSKEMKGISGNFYNLTNIEKPALHAQESAYSEKVFKQTKELIISEKS